MKLISYLKSRTVITFILLFIINGTESTKELLPENVIPIIDLMLVVIGSYFRINPKQEFDK